MSINVRKSVRDVRSRLNARRRQRHHRVRRRRFGVRRSSAASLSIAGELYDVPCSSVHALSFGRVALRGEEEKIQNLQVGACDYDDVHGTAGGHGTAVLATSIASAVAVSSRGSVALAGARRSCRRALLQRKRHARRCCLSCGPWAACVCWASLLRVLG